MKYEEVLQPPSLHPSAFCLRSSPAPPPSPQRIGAREDTPSDSAKQYTKSRTALTHLLHRRQQQADQDGDDGDHHQPLRAIGRLGKMTGAVDDRAVAERDE